MHTNPYVRQALKYATLTLALVIVVIAGIALTRHASVNSLSGRLVSPSDQPGTTLPTMHFDGNRAMQGFTVPADTHVLFALPNGVRIPRVTFLGGTDYDQNNRYWGYCFSGNEAANKAAGKIGKEMYDGQFFYSLAERKAQSERPNPAANDLLGILNQGTTDAPQAPASIAEIFHGGESCYVMSSIELPAGVDTDGDDVNNKLEQLLQTNPYDPDTDHDGIPDGTEMFVTTTSPTDPDSDRDGLTDQCEDKNMNGQVDAGETSTKNADTDRDGLCDGNGLASACPEAKQIVCTGSDPASRTCDVRPSTPVYGEDMNQNCMLDKDETDPTNPRTNSIPDWDYKWNAFQAQEGNRRN